MIETDKVFLTTGEAARLTGFTIQKIRALCKSGKLPSIDTSTGTRPRLTIRRDDLQAFLTPSAVKKAEARAKKPPRRQRIDAGVPQVFG